MKRLEFAKDLFGELKCYNYDVQSSLVRIDKEAPYNPYRTGYGSAIPTRYRVRTQGKRWHRVYCMCYGNSGTCYIRENNQLVFVDIM
jgi:hypothetical protein